MHLLIKYLPSQPTSFFNMVFIPLDKTHCAEEYRTSCKLLAHTTRSLKTKQQQQPTELRNRKSATSLIADDRIKYDLANCSIHQFLTTLQLPTNYTKTAFPCISHIQYGNAAFHFYFPAQSMVCKKSTFLNIRRTQFQPKHTPGFNKYLLWK